MKDHCVNLCEESIQTFNLILLLSTVSQHQGCKFSGHISKSLQVITPTIFTRIR